MTRDKQLGKEMLCGRSGQGPFSAWLVRQQPRSRAGKGCLLDPQEGERWHSAPLLTPFSLTHTHTHMHTSPSPRLTASSSLCLMTKIKPWNNIPNAEEGSSITPWYSSLPSTCLAHHPPPPPLPDALPRPSKAGRIGRGSSQRSADAYFTPLYMFWVIISVIGINFEEALEHLIWSGSRNQSK